MRASKRSFDSQPDRLEELIALVRAGVDYHTISIDLIRQVGRQELTKRRTLKEAVKHTRSRIHQVAGAYMGARIDYAQWSAQLEEVPQTPGEPALGDFCLHLMEQHASTRERLPIIERFFTGTLQSISPIGSILDVGCGLNPLTIPWMPLAGNFVYWGLDIYEDMVAFLNRFLAHYGAAGDVRVHDLSQGIPKDLQKVQLALMLKIFPCLEQLDKNLPMRLLKEIRAENVLISFPIYSLGGRSKGMLSYYEQHFMEGVEGKGWRITRFEFASELAFLLSSM
jgi:16S rRNA (guanine(1405)-N(7))-methyltransferase